MLDNPLEYKLKSNQPHLDKEPHYPDRTQVYIAFHQKVKIHIHVEHYDYIQFIKFFPHYLRDSDDKYRKRVRYNKNPNRIFSTCVKIAVDKFQDDPKTVIGVHGAWDQLDIKKRNNTTDRYELWFNFAVSKFDREKFTFFLVPEANSFFLMRKEYVDEETQDRMNNLLNDRFKEVIDSLMIPEE